MNRICKSIQGKLSRLIAGALPDAEREVVLAHLADCADCQACYERHRKTVVSETRRQSADDLAKTMAAMETRFDLAEARRLRERETLAGNDAPLSADEVATAPLEEIILRDDNADRGRANWLSRLFTPHPAWRWATILGSTLAVCVLIVVILDRDPQMPQQALRSKLDPEAGDMSRRPLNVSDGKGVPAPKMMSRKAAGTEATGDPEDTYAATDMIELPAVEASEPAAAAGAVNLIDRGPVKVIPQKEVHTQSADLDAVEGTAPPHVVEKVATEAQTEVAIDSEKIRSIIEKLHPLTGDVPPQTASAQLADLIQVLETAETELVGPDSDDAETAPDAAGDDKPKRASQAETTREKKRSSGQVRSIDRAEPTWGGVEVMFKGNESEHAQELTAYWLALGDGWFLVAEAVPQADDRRTYAEKALTAYQNVTEAEPLVKSHIARRISYLELLLQ